MSANSSADYNRRWREANRERLRKWGRDYYGKNRKKMLAQRRSERERNRDRYTETNRRYREANREVLSLKEKARRYGLLLADLAELLRKQRGRCAACGDKFTDSKHQHVDHDHATGKVRGILCRGCNHALGNVNDDVERLLELVAYLRRHR